MSVKTNLITAFCDDDITCNGQGKCDNNGVCQCIDSFYGEKCIGNFEYLAMQGNHLINFSTKVQNGYKNVSLMIWPSNAFFKSLFTWIFTLEFILI